MRDIVLGIIGVILGLSIVANAALVYRAYNNGESIFGISFAPRAEENAEEAPQEAAEEPAGEEYAASPAPVPDGLALYTSARAATELGDNLFKSVHSMVYDNEAVFYIAYSNLIAANEAGYDSRRADFAQVLGNLWTKNRDRFTEKNRSFSQALDKYEKGAYCTFVIVDDENHESIMAIISNGTLYYDYTLHAGADPFALYNTRWNKYIRRDLEDLLDNV